MSVPARRETKEMFPDLFDLFEMPLTALRPFTGQTGQVIRVEDAVEDDRYVVRAEMPGIDPEKDLEISVSRGVLTLRAERQETREGRRHSEFRYGSYERYIRLPENIREDEIKAAYDQGIVTITMPFEERKETTRRVPVER
ncbi:Hsp20/alpha crystallin family protein [Actinoallomurus acaciae]|uniref:Hsp20/alpha crystallin family protein n=1 Tax=Actinoallomurus acaciae TaxID=502577 RepID=A0ABV5YXT0_9ACTN